MNAFLVDGVYLFSQYFEEQEVFDRLERYYNGSEYRFEVPPDDFPEIQEFLDDHGYGLVEVEVIEEFVVVVRKYTTHPNNIFKDSVINRSVEGYNCFLLTDQDAVERACTEGATRLTATDLACPF